MKLSANVWKLYIIRFFSSLIPAYVIERLYWEQRGMTIPLVVYTELLYAITIILMEVPTGIMADRWGRQRMLVAGALLASLEFALLIPAYGFGSFALVVVVAGIGRSASSGSENALLYDTLVQLGRASSFEKHLGRLNACDFVGAVTAALAGSLLAGRYGLSLNYWVSLASTIIALTFTLLLVEPARGSRDEAADEAEARPPLRSYLTEPLRFFRLHPRVCLVMLSGMVTGASLVYIYEFWQLYADRLHFPVYAFGVLSSAIMLIQLPGSLAAAWLKERYGAGRLIAIILAAGAAGFACMAVSRSLWGLAAMAAVCFAAGLMEPIAAGYLHHRIPSPMRATIDSFQSLGQNGWSALAGLGFGYMSIRYEIFGGYGFLALLCAISFIGFVLLYPRTRDDKLSNADN